MKLKNYIKKRRALFWSFFHPDNLFNFGYANKAEKFAWEFLIEEMRDYNSICEIGCFNGKRLWISSDFLKNKIYIGFDLNIFAITIAKTLNFFYGKNKNSFYCNHAIFSAYQNCELFISIATLIYFSEVELKKYIKSLKLNKSFKAILMHEIFLNEELVNNKSILIDDNLNIHSISMIKKEFGKDFIIDIYRTFCSSWEKKDRISAILSIKKI